MQKIFLYRLFKDAKFFFVFALLFITVYAVVLRKQMDMLVFPINNMFSTSNVKDFRTFTYAVKLNGNIIKITDDPILKKDFSENSLQIFSRWLQADGKDLMTDFLDRKISDSARKRNYLNRLTPPKATIITWPAWFASFHHLKLTSGDSIEVWQYNFDFKESDFVMTDSLLVIKENVGDEF